MKTRSKILIGLIPLAALAFGAYFKTTQHNDSTKHSIEDVSGSPDVIQSTLLQAKLISDNGSSIVGDQLGELTLVNFWASWCSPCRQEMPIFETMYRRANEAGSEQAGFQIIGIAIDSQEKAQPFLDSMDITYPILYAKKTGHALMESTGNPQGLLPYSLLLDKDGKVLEQVLGRIHEEQIAGWLEQYL